jgi:hypothetical protein
MRYLDRFLIGIVLILVSFVTLWFGSPYRTNTFEVNPMVVNAYIILFALGFVFVSMGVLAMEDGYPAFLSGAVLYFMIGGLIASILYINQEGGFTLAELGDPLFWSYWIKRMAMWPMHIVEMTGMLGYQAGY